MSDLSATTKVTVELTGRRPTIADVRAALDVLTTEGIPDTFEVDIVQREDREYIDGVPHSERPVTLTFRVEAERASKSGGDPMTERTNEAFTGKLKPAEWCAELGAHILDPDGWRVDGRGWHEPITREEFDRRLAMCTIDSRGYPSFWKPTSHPEPPTGDGEREGVGRRG